jgi:hypothetical protein
MLNCQGIKRSFVSFGKAIQEIAISNRTAIEEGRLLVPAFFLAMDILHMCSAATSAIALTTDESQSAKELHSLIAFISCGFSAFATYTLVGGYCNSQETARVQFAESGDVLPVSVVAVSRANSVNNGNALGRC